MRDGFGSWTTVTEQGGDRGKISARESIQVRRKGNSAQMRAIAGVLGENPAGDAAPGEALGYR